MTMNQRFRRLTDLFIDGTAVALPDGGHLWVQALNSYERDEAISDAQIARSRLVLALREGGDERLKVEGLFARRGREAIIVDLAKAKMDEKYNEIVADLEDDPDWSERAEIRRRTDFDQASRPATAEERQLMDKLQGQWWAEITRRLEEEQAFQEKLYTGAPDEQIIADYLERWLEQRGAELANAEYTLTEMWYAVRYCDAVRGEDGELDHTGCEGHAERVFASKADARAVPERLETLLRAGLAELAVNLRDPKDSGNPPSSSSSSPPPSEEEESAPSTSTQIPAEVPGTSVQQSTTP